MNKIKIGFIGTGYMANEYAKVLISKLPFQVTLVGAVNKSNQRIIDFVKKYKVKKRYNNISQLMKLAKPEIVIVAVNELSTYSVIKELSKFKCICLIEKPVGINAKENKKISLIKKNKNFFPFIALNRRFYSSVLESNKILKKDTSKRIIKIFDQENIIIAKKNKVPTKVLNNWMYANSIHMLDFALIFGRGKIKRITTLNKKDYLEKKNISSRIEFNSGDLVDYFCIWNRPSPWSVQISTKKFFLELKPIEKLSYITNKDRKWINVSVSKNDEYFKPGIYLQILQLFEFYKNKTTKLKDLKYSNKIMNLIKEIYFD